MRTYEVTGNSISLFAGKVRLDENQARRRAHNLKSLGGGVYGIVREIQFKRGERFDHDGDIAKALGNSLIVIGDIVPPLGPVATGPEGTLKDKARPAVSGQRARK